MFNVMQESAVVKMQAEQKNNNMLEIHLYNMAIARGKLAKQFVMEPEGTLWEFLCFSEIQVVHWFLKKFKQPNFGLVKKYLF